MDKIKKISNKYKLIIIEDCAQAQGAKYKNKFVGNFGHFGCFSFYPTKILGTYGDGGFITTKNLEYYKKIKRLRFYGIDTVNKKSKYFNKYYANENGFNSRLDEIQSTILNIKIKKVDNYISKRIKLAKIYLNHLKNTKIVLPITNKFNKHVYHLFTIRHPKRNKIVEILKKMNIHTRTIYPYSINKMKAYKNFCRYSGKLKNSENFSKNIFSLPLYPELKEAQIKIICNTLKKILKKIN